MYLQTSPYHKSNSYAIVASFQIQNMLVINQNMLMIDQNMLMINQNILMIDQTMVVTDQKMFMPGQKMLMPDQNMSVQFSSEHSLTPFLEKYFTTGMDSY